MDEKPDIAEIARLDEMVARQDASDEPDARWRAADALYDKAQLVQEADDSEAALKLSSLPARWIGAIVQRIRPL